MKTTIFTTVLALVLFTGACTKHNTVSTPVAPAVSVEQNIFADLFTIQTTLEGFKAEADQYPAIKPVLNQAIAAYDVAEQAFQSYETAKSLNVADPAALVKIQAELLDLKSSIKVLGNSFKETN